MKKFFAIIAIAAFAVACNDTADKTKEATENIDSTVGAMKDTLNVQVDSAKSMIDSTAHAAKDSIKAKM